MRNALFFGLVVAAVSSAAWSASSSTGLPATLESKAKAAFADITKAKTALNGGKAKTSDSYLAKAESLLGSVLGQSSAAANGNAQGNDSAVSRAEGEAAKLDPSLAARFGIGKDQSGQEGADAGTAAQGQTQNSQGQQSMLAKLEGVYQKVTAARTLLQAGNNSQAKSLLDQIPSSPLALLRTASGL
jgi:hypothetical protein